MFLHYFQHPPGSGMPILSLFHVSAPLLSCDADLCNADLVAISRECATLALLCKSKESLAWQVVLHVGFVRVALFMASERGSRFRNVSLPGSWINHVRVFAERSPTPYFYNELAPSR